MSEMENANCPSEEMTEKEAGIYRDKGWRAKLDDVLQDIKKCPTSRERALTVTKIQEAIMWLGMDLKRLNDGESPYTGSYDCKDPSVHPVSDGLKM